MEREASLALMLIIAISLTIVIAYITRVKESIDGLTQALISDIETREQYHARDKVINSGIREINATLRNLKAARSMQ